MGMALGCRSRIAGSHPASVADREKRIVCRLLQMDSPTFVSNLENTQTDGVDSKDANTFSSYSQGEGARVVLCLYARCPIALEAWWNSVSSLLDMACSITETGRREQVRRDDHIHGKTITY